MFTPYIYYIARKNLLICCLLSWLSVTAAGQTSAPYVAQKEGVEWHEMLLSGGMMRQYTDLLDTHRGWYMIMPNGLTDVVTMNFVDGYSLGLHSTVGRMSLDRSRWEAEESLYWAFNRKTLVGKVALRYVRPVEYETFIELYGGKFLEDFDEDPVMPRAQSLMASGICGWNHYKLYEQTSAGIRFSTPLVFDLKMTGKVGWERRRGVENTKLTNLFGAHAESNVPRVGVPYTAHDLALYEGPIDAEVLKASLRFDYKRGRGLVVMDDMTVREKLEHPTYSLLVDLGTGTSDSLTEKKFNYLALDVRVSHTMRLPRENDLLSFMASTGFMLSHGEIGLADMHHFDASKFWWQKHAELSRFALLDNYELSTDDHWLEGHVEWNSQRMLVNRFFTPKEDWREFVQLHVVKVPHHKAHWETQYGWALFKKLRVGVSLGFDNFVYRGTAVSFSLDLNTAR